MVMYEREKLVCNQLPAQMAANYIFYETAPGRIVTGQVYTFS